MFDILWPIWVDMIHYNYYKVNVNEETMGSFTKDFQSKSKLKLV